MPPAEFVSASLQIGRTGNSAYGIVMLWEVPSPRAGEAYMPLGGGMEA